MKQISDSTTVRISGSTDQLLKTLAAELGQPETEVADRALLAWYHLFYTYGPVPGLITGTPEAPVHNRHWVMHRVDERVAYLRS
jgi:hypothetical protein